MSGWRPDWQEMVRQAVEIDLEECPGAAYVVADTHLGDTRAAPEAFVELLDALPQPGVVILLGDLFKVWLALPRYANDAVRTVLAALARLRERGARLVFVVGNREYFVPADAARARAQGLPFDHVVPGMAFLSWGGRRYGLAHGDLVNRNDRQYLRWRRISRSAPVGLLFRALPSPLARRIAQGLEASLAGSNQEIKIAYPAEEVRAFAETVAPHCDRFLIGHFHRDDVLRTEDGAELRIVPDWFSRRTVLRLEPSGELTALRPEDFTPGGPAALSPSPTGA